ncbi:twitching motility protein PilT [Halobacteriales archaeon SW_10_68_16]|jgi:rRNA-processing protein FCF1|nr:MAG: twitching motility protein PilT [Halobacteriales archaeon SW_10_68_16]
MSVVVLDTNALMLPVECDVRVFEELDRLLGAPTLVVPAAAVAELEALADNGSGTAASEEARAARVGLDLAKRCEVRETDAEYADDAVVELAQAGDVTHVVTNDQPLQERLRGADVSVIRLRGRNKLAINV